jgi:fatty-acyl-CoA synthase
MQSLMQDYPLTVQHVLWRAEKLFARKEIVTKREDHTHRYTYGDMAARVKQLANVLTKLGVAPGAPVGTLAWNNYRHLELYYAIPCMGAVLHTLNLRLFPEQLAFVINDAADKVIFVDKTLIPILNRVAGMIPTVEKIVVLNDGGPLPPHNLGELLDYETLMSEAAADFTWPELDERAAAAMCYTSGTTGNPRGSSTATARSSSTRWASSSAAGWGWMRPKSSCQSCRCSTPTVGGSPTPLAWPAQK